MEKVKSDNTLLTNGVVIDGIFFPKKNLPSGTLRIILTTKCNYRCKYCFNEGEKDKNIRIQSLENIKKIVNVAKDFGINSIKLTGGEPLLYPQISELLQYLQMSGIGYYDFTTNVSMLTEENIEMLNKYNVSSLTLSVNTLKKEQFYYLSGCKEYEQYIEKIHNVIKIFKGKLRINCIVFDKNYEVGNYLEIQRLCMENNMGLRFVEPSKVEGFPITYTKEKFIELTDELRKKCDEIIKSDCSSVEYLVFGGWYLTIMHSLCDNKLCDNCKDYMYIRLTSDGKLKPCLKRRDTEVVVDYTNEESIKKSLVKAIRNMGNGLNE